jgi:hypothetical protein
MIGYVVFLNRLRVQKLAPIILGIVAFGLILFAIIYFASPDYSEKFLQRFTVAQPYDLGREGRYNRYLLVLPMILDNPIGLGLLQLDKIFPEPIHNIWLSSFVNYGWFGGFTWIVLFFSSMVISVQNYRRTRSPIAILLMFSLLGIVMCASLHQGEHWRQLWLFYGLLWGFNPANFVRSAAPPNGLGAHRSIGEERQLAPDAPRLPVFASAPTRGGPAGSPVALGLPRRAR